MLALSALPGAAQDIVTPIGIGQNLTGMVNSPEAGQLFRLETDMPQAVSLQLLSQTPGFAPSFRLMDGNGLTLQAAANAAGLSLLDSQLPLPSGDLYLEVGSANGAVGQFMLAIQTSLFATGPSPLALGQAQTGRVDGLTPELLYSFDAPADQSAELMVDRLSPAHGVTVALRDGLSGELLSLSNMRFGGLDFEIVAGSGSYLVEVMHSASDVAEDFSICLAAQGATGCEPAAAVASCAVAASVAVNVRSGAGMNYGVIGTLPAGASAPVVGSANGWLMIDLNGLNGWVAAAVVGVSGECGSVPLVNVPPQAIDPGIGNGQPGVDTTQTGGLPDGGAGDDTLLDLSDVPPEVIDGINDAVNDAAGDPTIPFIPGLDLDLDGDDTTINPPIFNPPVLDLDGDRINDAIDGLGQNPRGVSTLSEAPRLGE